MMNQSANVEEIIGLNLRQQRGEKLQKLKINNIPLKKVSIY